MRKIWHAVFTAILAFDWPLLFLLGILSLLGLTVMQSAVGLDDPRFADQYRNFIIAFFLMWGVALLPPHWIERFAVPIYLGAVVLLLGVEFFGESSKGAKRWLNLGVLRLQPSEGLKLAVPIMLAWYFRKQQQPRVGLLDLLVALLILFIPFFLIVRQPDLGTALLVLAVGLCVIYFAGFPFRWLLPLAFMVVGGFALMWHYEELLCAPEFDWHILHDYQKHRICTLLNPSSDPLGKGFHTIQSMIAVGSGGIYGKGFMQGTQAHLDFIPERSTDFIFAVYAEEFGLYGGLVLLTLYGLVVLRALLIAAYAPTQFGRLLAGAMGMMLAVYVFVNIGMVTGVLPVVGVPLPFLSYGGTALMTLAIACGLLMSISRHPDPQAQQ
ncbi:MAG TPA: rod shape-determining protein RodA [Paenalcaligenes sp.]|nr:rod shape-determining protein RodA [Paenalcaligenes sp.]